MLRIATSRSIESAVAERSRNAGTPDASSDEDKMDMSPPQGKGKGKAPVPTRARDTGSAGPGPSRSSDATLAPTPGRSITAPSSYVTRSSVALSSPPRMSPAPDGSPPSLTTGLPSGNGIERDPHAGRLRRLGYATRRAMRQLGLPSSIHCVLFDIEHDYFADEWLLVVMDRLGLDEDSAAILVAAMCRDSPPSDDE
ncbi:hypothetical protein CERSUDRAFT_97024 [Gelatoporia subvermispora B]|uniref:Uncharacterized protein n=1 Tax=Ceriporiopsis subvermispora (strain B) TaxID=914234 RepID=M2QDJ1_CERS8|nr:hypothetical protein CERSUDRAFT_97024 [Gelatoporia subvermispora B]